MDNISSIRVLANEFARIRARDLLDLELSSERFPEVNIISQYAPKAAAALLKTTKGGTEVEVLLNEGVWWSGECSGSTYDSVFIARVAPLIKGRLDLMVAWNEGDSYSGLRIVDGVATECELNIQLSMQRVRHG